jgi:hypothetical protein
VSFGIRRVQEAPVIGLGGEDRDPHAVALPSATGRAALPCTARDPSGAARRTTR